MTLGEHAVQRLHAPDPRYQAFCAHCSKLAGRPKPWPCPTVLALAFGIEPVRKQPDETGTSDVP